MLSFDACDVKWKNENYRVGYFKPGYIDWTLGTYNLTYNFAFMFY